MDRQEVWEHIVSAVEREFTSGEFGVEEFYVHTNPVMRSISVIERATSQSVQLLDVSFAYYTGGSSENKPICVHLPANGEQSLEHVLAD